MKIIHLTSTLLNRNHLFAHAHDIMSKIVFPVSFWGYSWKTLFILPLVTPFWNTLQTSKHSPSYSQEQYNTTRKQLVYKTYKSVCLSERDIRQFNRQRLQRYLIDNIIIYREYIEDNLDRFMDTAFNHERKKAR